MPRSHLRFHLTNRAVRPRIQPFNSPVRRTLPWWMAPAFVGVACAALAIAAGVFLWNERASILVANAGPRPAPTQAIEPTAAVVVAAAPAPTAPKPTATPSPTPTEPPTLPITPVDAETVLRRRSDAEPPIAVGNWPIVAITPAPPVAEQAISPTPTPEPDQYYTVRSGDTFSGIAAALGVDEDQMARLNQVTDRDHLTVGQRLKVPTRPGRADPNRAARVQVNNAAAFRPHFIWPSVGYVTTEFGEQGSVWIGGMHMGLDIAAPPGHPVLASEAGKVLEAGWSTNRGYGNYVVIDHGMGYRTLYGHMLVLRVKEGQDVRQGQLIGDVGSTGVSSGPHLHFEIQDWGKPVDPLPFIGEDQPTNRLRLPRTITGY